jgi:hypothetical protein
MWASPSSHTQTNAQNSAEGAYTQILGFNALSSFLLLLLLAARCPLMMLQ